MKRSSSWRFQTKKPIRLIPVILRLNTSITIPWLVNLTLAVISLFSHWITCWTVIWSAFVLSTQLGICRSDPQILVENNLNLFEKEWPFQNMALWCFYFKTLTVYFLLSTNIWMAMSSAINVFKMFVPKNRHLGEWRIRDELVVAPLFSLWHLRCYDRSVGTLTFLCVLLFCDIFIFYFYFF